MANFLKRGLTIATLTLGVFTAPLKAQTDSAEEVIRLRQLIGELKQQLGQLEADVARLESAQTETVQTASMPDPAPTLPPEKPEKSETFLSKLDLKLYGYVKLDVFHDSVTTSHQDIPYWALKTGGGELDVTARQTRIGLDIGGPSDALWGGSLAAKFEMDFFAKVPTPGDVSGNHGYTPRSRKIYATWTNEDWELLFGKTFEAYILETPETLNFSYYNFQGQLGHRRAQIRLTRKFDLGSGSALRVTGALDEPVGRIHGGDIDGDNVDDGTDAEFPGLVGKVRYTFPFAGKNASIGVSGFYAQEELDQTYEAFAFITGGSFPLLTDWLKLTGVFWYGQNLDSAWGGIGQGINSSLDTASPSSLNTAIEAWGGWTQLRVQPLNWMHFNLGYSVDNPLNDDLDAGDRSCNTTFLTNAYFQLADPLTLGLEYFMTDTDYLAESDAVNHRVQSALIYKF